LQEEAVVPVVSFVGYHNSGKTTFATKVVEVLKSRGLKIAVLKSTKHEKVIEDKEGKDSYRYKQAGANAVGIVCPRELVLFEDVDEIDLNYLAFRLFYDYDLVVCEGFKRQEVPKIEVLRKELGQPSLVGKVEGSGGSFRLRSRRS
jgi:molybdopterin-guanine dinucleotide biosynthesis protein B